MAVTSDVRLRTARERMVDNLRLRRGIQDERLLDALRSIERHRFLDTAYHERAYGPYALPIGAGQKMPHPHTVAVMAQALELRGHERILEIGTGSGYQTAVLAALGAAVWSLERMPELARGAAACLEELGIANVELQVSARLRWRDAAPFDAIHVSASVPEVPGVLLAQLAPQGRLVLPVGRSPHQRLLLLLRRGDSITTQSLGACRFEPLLGELPERAAAWTGEG
jgi:protein-L-isoaspartate(D-aspartate) O-methyltransferase